MVWTMLNGCSLSAGRGNSVRGTESTGQYEKGRAMSDKRRVQGRTTEGKQPATFEDRVRALIREEAARDKEQRRTDRRNRRQERLRRLTSVLAVVLSLAIFGAYMTAYVDTPPLARVLLSAVAVLSVLVNGFTAHELLRRRRTRPAEGPLPGAGGPGSTEQATS